MILKLNNPVARQAACTAVMNAPIGWVVRISEPTRSLEANALLHAELQEISRLVKWGGSLQDIETWKRLLTAAWMRATDRKVTLLPALEGGGFDVLYQRTSTLGKGEMSELIEYTKAWKADREEFQ